MSQAEECKSFLINPDDYQIQKSRQVQDNKTCQDFEHSLQGFETIKDKNDFDDVLKKINDFSIDMSLSLKPQGV